MSLSKDRTEKAKEFLQAGLRQCQATGMIPVGIVCIDPESLGDVDGAAYYRATGPEEAMGVALTLLHIAAEQIALHGQHCPCTLPYALDLAIYEQAQREGPKEAKPPF